VSGGSNAATPKNDLQGLKILVIDDSKTIRRTAETLLAKEGCEVFTAVDGFDALSKIADHRPDIHSRSTSQVLTSKMGWSLSRLLSRA
jgi:CheY-like chemotaxis protein